jgi:hypothetical protein
VTCDEPSLVRFLERMSSFSRHVSFDLGGPGHQDRLPHYEDRFAEAGADLGRRSLVFSRRREPGSPAWTLPNMPRAELTRR